MRVEQLASAPSSAPVVTSHSGEPEPSVRSVNEPVVTSHNAARVEAISPLNSSAVTSHNSHPVTSHNEGIVTTANEPAVTTENDQSQRDLDEPDSDDERRIEIWRFEFSKGAKFKVEPDGCLTPRWKNIQWFDQEGGHRFLYVVKLGRNKNGNVTRETKYGRYYPHKTLKFFLEGEYGSEIEQFQSEHSAKVRDIRDHRVTRRRRSQKN